MNRFLVLFLFLTGCSGIQANIKNDLFAHTDNNFTNGVDLKTSYKPNELFPAVSDVVSSLPSLRLRDSDPEVPSRYVFALSQQMYTPRNIISSYIQYDDSPYAGSLTINTKKISSDEDFRISTQLRLGTSGPPSGAADAQKFVHDTLTKLGRDQVHPNGWQHQIVAEPLANLDYERAYEDVRYENRFYTATTQGSSIARLGNIETELELDYGFKFGNRVPRLNRGDKESLSVYIVSNLFGIARAHNLYYQGGIFRDSPHTVAIERFIGGIENGIVFDWGASSFRFMLNTRTRDFKIQEDATHTYGFLCFGNEW